MRAIFTEPFKEDYLDLPSEVKELLDKALRFLLSNPRHPSLRVQKLPQTSIWYARITRNYRFTFQLEKDFMILRRAGDHGILKKERRSKR